MIASSCDRQKPSNYSPLKIETNGHISKDKTDPPQVILLESMPKPQSIDVPSKAGDFYIAEGDQKGTKIELLPPEIKPAGFFHIMPSYTIEQGLALDVITCGMIDKKGNLWFGTQGGGVSRYDGKSFTNYLVSHGLAANYIRCIFEDRKGHLWFGTYAGGVSQYDGTTFTTYTMDQGLPNNIVSSILEDKEGNLWFGTNGGASTYDGKTFTTYKIANNNILKIIEDKVGNLWFGTEGGGVSKYDGQVFTSFTTAQGLANDVIWSILEDKTGTLWFGTDGGVSRYDGKVFINYSTAEGLTNNSVKTILEDKTGNLWFGTFGGGVSHYDGKNFTNYTAAQGLANNFIRSIVEDKIGNLWFGTFGKGVCRYDGKSFTNYTTAQGLTNNTVWSIVEDKGGNFWFGTNEGVSKYDAKTFTQYTTKQGLPDNIVYGIYEDKKGNLWFGTEGGGVSKFDGKTFTNYTTTQGLVHNVVSFILEDKTGNFWFATRGGVSKFDGKSFTTYATAQGLANNIVFSIHEDEKGNLWFGTFGGGVSKFDGQSFTTYNIKDGLANNFVYCIFGDEKGNIWFGTDGGGMSRYDGQSFSSYTTSQGMADNNIHQIGSTKERDIIVGTVDGLSILKGYTSKLSTNLNSSMGPLGSNRKIDIPAQNNLTNDELKNYLPVFEIFTPKIGFPINSIARGQNSIYLDSDGKVWIGTGSDKVGLVQFDYAALHKSRRPPELFIRSVKIDNEKVSWYDLKNPPTKNEGPNITEEVSTFGKILSDKERDAMRHKFKDIHFDNIEKWYPVPENLELPHKNNNISFEFAAIEPDYPQDVLYQYKLEGYDKDWSPATNHTNAIFGNIFEGTYEFKLKAQSPFGIWSEPITYTFKVLPPWFRTWWAYALYALSSVTAIYLIFRWRTAALRKRKEELEILYSSAERFVPKRFLQLLNKKHLEEVQLGDSVKREISVMFADMRGFTTIAESLTPERTALFLNTYMHHMEPVIRKHDGFINQFLGDGILATFPENPSDAVDAAVEMIQMVPKFNEEVERMGFSPITIGIGINTGEAMIIALGVKERMDASVVSDTINTASRVEGLNKFYKTQLLISESVYQQLTHPEKYLIRMVDKVILKGKHVGKGIYEVSPLPPKKALQNERRYIALFNEAFVSYAKGDFKKAELSFKLCLQQKPSDAAAQLLLERCVNFQKVGAPEGWDGTYTLKEK